MCDLVNEILDLCGVEVACYRYSIVLFILRGATDFLKVIFKGVHCFLKCGVPLYGWAGNYGSSAKTVRWE